MTTTAISMIRSRSGDEAGHLEVDPDQVVVVAGQFGVGHRRRSLGEFSQRPRRRCRAYTFGDDPPAPGRCVFAARAGRLARRCAPGSARRQVRHVARHRDAVPRAVRRHGRRSRRTARPPTTPSPACRLGHWQMAFGAVVLLGWTLFGGLDALNAALRDVARAALGRPRLRASPWSPRSSRSAACSTCRSTSTRPSASSSASASTA